MDHEIRARLAKASYREKGTIVDEIMEEPMPNYDVSVAATSEDESEIAVRTHRHPRDSAPARSIMIMGICQQDQKFYIGGA